MVMPAKGREQASPLDMMHATRVRSGILNERPSIMRLDGGEATISSVSIANSSTTTVVEEGTR